MRAVKSIDKIGTAGLFITALFSPCCFPLFAFAATALGLGSFELFGGWTMWVYQAMVVVSLAGLYISYRGHRKPYPLLGGALGAAAIFYGYHLNESEAWIYFLYAGMAALLAATALNFYMNKQRTNKATLESTITCPACGHQKQETMPTDACVYFYECESCHTRLKPAQGDCCVYCSYGSVKCPPIQAGANCC